MTTQSASADLDTAAPGPAQALFVLPGRHGNGFSATIRGQMLELADPRSGHALAPTPEDLLITSIAADLAWSTQCFLRTRGLPDSVSVSGAWRTKSSPPALADIEMTVVVSRGVDALRTQLLAVLENGLARRALRGPIRICVQIS
jgi:hypothetical protein